MCRHLGYLGPRVPLCSLLYDPPHSLRRQSYAPKLNLSNVLNADGFGVGWHDGDRTVRYRRSVPIWTDVSFAEVAEVVSAGSVVAAVRSATSGFPVDESCAQPLRCESWLFSHNGAVQDFGSVETKLRDLAGELSAVPEARAPVDSALLLAIAVGRWRAGRSLGEGLADTVIAVAALALGRYNLLAADGRSLAATTWGDSLFVRSLPEAAVIASEPYDDDPGWQRVPDGSLVTASLRGHDPVIHIRPLSPP
jgi:gamma-glutamyl hercynylcysteine S-oxide hydrolase